MEVNDKTKAVTGTQEPKDKEKTNNDVPEFTPEQQAYVDRIVSGIKNENKRKLDDVTKDNDKRVKDAVQEQLEERERRAKMSAEEKAAEDRKKLEEKNKRLEAQLEQRDRIDYGRQIASQYHIPSSMIERLIGKTNEETVANMKSFADDYARAVQAGVDSRLAGTQQPQLGSQAKIDNTKSLSDLSLEEQTKLYRENPDLYNQLVNR